MSLHFIKITLCCNISSNFLMHRFRLRWRQIWKQSQEREHHKKCIRRKKRTRCFSQEAKIVELPLNDFRAMNYLVHSKLIQKFNHLVEKTKLQNHLGFRSPNKLQRRLLVFKNRHDISKFKENSSINAFPKDLNISVCTQNKRLFSADNSKPRREVRGDMQSMMVSQIVPFSPNLIAS